MATSAAWPAVMNNFANGSPFFLNTFACSSAAA